MSKKSTVFRYKSSDPQLAKVLAPAFEAVTAAYKATDGVDQRGVIVAQLIEDTDGQVIIRGSFFQADYARIIGAVFQSFTKEPESAADAGAKS